MYMFQDIVIIYWIRKHCNAENLKGIPQYPAQGVISSSTVADPPTLFVTSAIILWGLSVSNTSETKTRTHVQICKVG
jgi:hypothetical protein